MKFSYTKSPEFIAGKKAVVSGKSKSDCPYIETFNGDVYLESDAFKRQKWIAGFNEQCLLNEYGIGR